MRTETITRTLYTFEELTPEAQAKAIEANRYINTDDTDWHEYTIEYVQELCATFGLDIEKVMFTGFSSQGDGAMFVGSYSYKKGGCKALAAYAPEIPAEVTAIAAELQELQKKHGYRIFARMSHDNGRYYHENSMDVDTWDTVTEESGKFYSNGAEVELTKILRRLAKWIYRTLEKNYDGLTSDETVKETIEANACEFTEDGDRA